MMRRPQKSTPSDEYNTIPMIRNIHEVVASQMEMITRFHSPNSFGYALKFLEQFTDQFGRE
jgi:hypothetical protein